MNLVVRRRLATGALLSSSALVAGLLLAPSSDAASGGLQVIPSSVVNTDSAVPMTYKSDNVDFTIGSTETFARIGGGQPFTDSTGQQTSPTADKHAGTHTKDFTDVDGSPSSGGGVGVDGPADAGVYNVSVVGKNDPTGGQIITGGTDNCTSCFTVLSPGAVSVTGATPTSYRPGATGNITIAGNNFERGSHVDFLFSDGSVDPLIMANANPKDYSQTGNPDIIDKISTRKSLIRTAKVDTNDAPGARGMRVTNLDGNTASCTACFFVAGPALTSISPTGGVNDPGTVVKVDFNGASTASGTPRLEFAGNPGGSTRDALSLDPIAGTTAQSGSTVTAQFDLSNAAPGPYQAVVRDSSSGVTNACETPCAAFTVRQQDTRKPPTLTGLDRDPNTAGNQNDQQAGTTQVFTVAGTNFSKGVSIKTTAAKTTVTAVEFVSPTQVKATLVTAKDETAGDYDVTATLTDNTASAACSKCYTVTAATPSPSASSTVSPSGSATCPTSGSASPTATSTASPTATGTASPTATGTASPTATSTASPTATSTASPTATNTASPTASSTSSAKPASCQQLTINVNPTDIVPTEASTVYVHGSANQPVELYAYSRPSITYGVVRRGRTDASGDISWDVTPGENTRLYAHYTSGSTTTASTDSESTVIEVHTSLSLSAYRDGVRAYHFQGTNLPRRSGQLITLYRYATGANLDQYCVPTAESDTTAKDDGGCHAIITSQAKTGPNNTWRIDRTFTGSGQFYFVVRTSKNLNNGRGHSNQRLTVIH